MRIHVNGTPEFSGFFQALDKENQLYKTIDAILERIAENPSMGEFVRFERIHKVIKRRYPDITNIFRVKVTQDWRLLYTLVGYPKNKTAYILITMSHKEYDKIFK